MTKLRGMAIALGLLSLPALAQNSFNLSPTGMTGSAGAGVVLFKIKEPRSNFLVDQGIYAALGGERGLGYAHLFLTLSLAYLTTEGQTNYNYSTLSGDNYTGTDVNYRANVFEGGLGLKFKLLVESFFRPYIEGGGLGGYFQLDYKDIATRVTGPGSAAKSKDALLEFGYYWELGTEISFSPSFGLRVAARFTENASKPFKTLGDSKVTYKSEIYYLNLLKQF